MIVPLIGGLLLAALVILPGYAVWRALAEPRQTSSSWALTRLEHLAVIASGGALITGWLALILAEIGWLRLPVLALLSLPVTVALLWLARRRPPPAPPMLARLTPIEWLFLAAAAIALLLGLRPHQLVIGGLDAGVYVNTGASIARSGRLLISDPITADLSSTAGSARPAIDSGDAPAPAVDGAIRHLLGRLPERRFLFADYLRLNGFYVLELASGTLTPQFLHLYPTWLGLVGAATGDQGMLYATPVLAWLGAVMAGLTAARLFGAPTGVATLMLLGLNSLQIWFGRHSLSESLLQFLLCTAAYGWVAAHQATPEQRGREPARLPLLLAGLALGSLSLAHAQFVFAYGLLPLLAIWLWLSRRWRRAHWAFFGPLLILSVHAGIHIGIFALGYMEGLYHHVIFDELWPRRVPLTLGLIVGGLILAGLNRWRDRWWPLVTHPRLRQPALPLLAGVSAAILAWAYVMRPGIILEAAREPSLLAGYIGAPVAPGVAANLVRLGWYFSPLGMVLAGIGLTAIVRRLDQRMLVWLGLAGVYGLAFNIASFTHEGYIYSLRRFVPIVVPTLSIAIAYASIVVIPGWLATGRLAGWRRWLARGSAGALLASLMLFFAITGRTVISHVEYEGAAEQIAAIAARFSPRDIILFCGDRDEPHKLATPLRFFYGLDTLVVSTNNPRGDLIDGWLAEHLKAGRRLRVVLGNNGGKLLLPGYRLEPAGDLRLTLREYERLTEQKPFNVQTNTIEYTLYDVVPAAGAPLAGPPFRYQTGPGDELATVIGWYGREQDADGTAYRWTNGDALLRLPWPANRGPLRLRLALSGGVRPAQLGPARVEIGLARGQNDLVTGLATLTLTEQMSVYEIVIPPDALPDQPTNTVMLALYNNPRTSPAWVPASQRLSSDPRLLGVRLAWAELTPAG